MNAKHRKFTRLAVLAGVLVLLAVLLYGLLKDDAAAFWSYALDEETHPVLFIAMYVLLPMFGFPISVFLVLLGVKFGGWLGVLIMFAGIPFHLLAALLVSRSFLQRWLQRLFNKLDYRLPQVPGNRQAWFGFVFMAVPGLSYSVKNYVLALSGISRRIFFVCGFFVQGIMGIPMVIAGDAAAEKSLAWLAAVVIVIVLLYVIIDRMRKRARIDISEC